MSSKQSLLRHPLASFGKWALLIGLFLFLLGIFLFVIIGVVAGSYESAFIVLPVVSLQGIVWGIIGLVFAFISNANVKKLRELKQSGKRFDAEIVNLLPVIGVNASLHAPTVYAECIYMNSQQQSCKVKSTMFLWENLKHEKLEATVYVDWNEPRRYAVEITQRKDNQPEVDIDYT